MSHLGGWIVYNVWLAIATTRAWNHVVQPPRPYKPSLPYQPAYGREYPILVANCCNCSYLPWSWVVYNVLTVSCWLVRKVSGCITWIHARVVVIANVQLLSKCCRQTNQPSGSLIIYGCNPTIQIANLANYNYHPLEDRNNKMHTMHWRHKKLRQKGIEPHKNPNM